MVYTLDTPQHLWFRIQKHLKCTLDAPLVLSLDAPVMHLSAHGIGPGDCIRECGHNTHVHT
eukprot:1159243-Pelagomonas_calceolata.AAC.3